MVAASMELSQQEALMRRVEIAVAALLATLILLGSSGGIAKAGVDDDPANPKNWPCGYSSGPVTIGDPGSWAAVRFRQCPPIPPPPPL
jgi:hypothetical protein